jgi:hypothetical protein
VKQTTSSASGHLGTKHWHAYREALPHLRWLVPEPIYAKLFGLRRVHNAGRFHQQSGGSLLRHLRRLAGVTTHGAALQQQHLLRLWLRL